MMETQEDRKSERRKDGKTKRQKDGKTERQKDGTKRRKEERWQDKMTQTLIKRQKKQYTNYKTEETKRITYYIQTRGTNRQKRQRERLIMRQKKKNSY